MKRMTLLALTCSIFLATQVYAMAPHTIDMTHHEEYTDGDSTFHGMGFNMRNISSGPQIYDAITIDTSNDPFVDPNAFNNLVGGKINFIDENNDGICDYVQDTTYFESLGIGPFVDENGDSIHDEFETLGFYRAMGMNNFVDVDGDGLCDNYEENPWEINATNNMRMEFGTRVFARFEVRTDEDLFVNPTVFNNLTRGVLTFVDENNDGICDYVQDTTYFESLGIGPFVDENGDSIHDEFETLGFYRAMGMNNFVDVDGDGLCDNYEESPLGHTTP